MADLLEHYPVETPVPLVQKATWPQERVYEGTLGTLLAEVEPRDWLLSTMMLVGEVLRADPKVIGLFESLLAHVLKLRATISRRVEHVDGCRRASYDLPGVPVGARRCRAGGLDEEAVKNRLTSFAAPRYCAVAEAI